MGRYFSGKDGKLLVGGTTVGQLQNWSFSQSMSILEITAMGDTDRTIKPGVRSYSGSARAYYYTANSAGAPNVTDLLTAAIKDSGTESTKVTLVDSVPLDFIAALNKSVTSGVPVALGV